MLDEPRDGGSGPGTEEPRRGGRSRDGMRHGAAAGAWDWASHAAVAGAREEPWDGGRSDEPYRKSGTVYLGYVPRCSGRSAGTCHGTNGVIGCPVSPVRQEGTYHAKEIKYNVKRR